jgi:hypothetical protein
MADEAVKMDEVGQIKMIKSYYKFIPKNKEFSAKPIGFIKGLVEKVEPFVGKQVRLKGKVKKELKWPIVVYMAKIEEVKL